MAKCACDLCGQEAGAGLFLPGHDQKLRAHLESRMGGLLAMRELVRALEAYASGKTTQEEMARAVRESFWRA